MKRTGPRYRPSEVERLAAAGRVVLTRRVVAWLANHDYDAAATVVDVLTRLTGSSRWLGSVTLINGATADEYVVSLEDEDWYLKFHVDEAAVVVMVWSCCWDGAVH